MLTRLTVVVSPDSSTIANNAATADFASMTGPAVRVVLDSATPLVDGIVVGGKMDITLGGLTRSPLGSASLLDEGVDPSASVEAFTKDSVNVCPTKAVKSLCLFAKVAIPNTPSRVTRVPGGSRSSPLSSPLVSPLRSG